MFDSPTRLLLGLLTGIVFGFLLQKGQVAKYRVIVGQFLLRDFTVVKVMGTAVIVGSIGFYALHDWGLASLHVKPLLWSGVVVGGICFGIGMAILGYCPGTCVAACGEGRRDAMIGVLGMLVGAGVFVAFFAAINRFMHAWGDWGKVTLPEMTGVSPWVYILALVAVALVAVALSVRRGTSSHGALGSARRTPENRSSGSA
jgi:uncharacterized membrane protein YedE/YeeE